MLCKHRETQATQTPLTHTHTHPHTSDECFKTLSQQAEGTCGYVTGHDVGTASGLMWEMPRPLVVRAITGCCYSMRCHVIFVDVRLEMSLRSWSNTVAGKARLIYLPAQHVALESINVARLTHMTVLAEEH